jgi:putative Mg2+ transporter-C (MgtC) family protein
MIIANIPWENILTDAFRLVLAYVLALPVGMDREKEDRSAGVRTFPIVAVASCGLATLALEFPNATPDAYSRVLQGLVTGIGFIGGGAILKEKGSVSGTATAASVWNIGITGAAVGLGVYHIAIILTVINLITLKVFRSLKKEGPREGQSILLNNENEKK